MSDEGKKEQTNVRSFRVTNDVMGRFKEIQEEMRLTQDGALKMLVDTYELEQAKNAIPDRETEISNFQLKANELIEAFLHSLQLNQDAEARIRSEVELQLQSKDRTIMDLQEKVREQEESVLASRNITNAEINKRQLAEQALMEAQERTLAAEKTARDKEAIAEMLTVKLTEAEGKLEEYPTLKASERDLKEQLAEALQNIKDIQKDAHIAQERAVASIQKEMDKALAKKDQSIASAELKAEKALSKLEKEKNTEIQKLRDQIDGLKDERSDLRESNANIKAELIKANTEIERLKKERSNKP